MPLLLFFQVIKPIILVMSPMRGSIYWIRSWFCSVLLVKLTTTIGWWNNTLWSSLSNIWTWTTHTSQCYDFNSRLQCDFFHSLLLDHERYCLCDHASRTVILDMFTALTCSDTYLDCSIWVCKLPTVFPQKRPSIAWVGHGWHSVHSKEWLSKFIPPNNSCTSQITTAAATTNVKHTFQWNLVGDTYQYSLCSGRLFEMFDPRYYLDPREKEFVAFTSFYANLPIITITR